MYKQDLTFNHLQGLICPATQPNQTYANYEKSRIQFYILKITKCFNYFMQLCTICFIRHLFYLNTLRLLLI